MVRQLVGVKYKERDQYLGGGTGSNTGTRWCESTISVDNILLILLQYQPWVNTRFWIL